MAKTRKKTTKKASQRKPQLKKRKLKKARAEKTEERIKKIKIRLIGIGGGGSSIVSEIAQRVKGASFFAANTDLKALGGLSKKVRKFHFGQDLTHGLGTGMNPQIGEEAAKNERERIKNILEGQDFVILVACLGGGLGSGAAPIFARISKNLGNLTYGIFTLPFKFEGEKKMEIAKNSLDRLRTNLNTLSIIPNERIFQIIDRTTPLKKALSATNKNLSDSLQSLIEIISKPGLINIDFADLRTIFEGRGRLTYLNSIEVGKDDDKEAIEKVINFPLYPYGIEGAKGVLFNISGQKNLSLAQVDQISRTISGLVHKEAKIIFGISKTQKGSKIKLSLLATGCGQRSLSGRSKKRSKPKSQPKPQPSSRPKPKPESKPKPKPKQFIKPQVQLKKKKVEPKKIKVKIIQPKTSTHLKKRPVKKKKVIKKEVKIRKNAIQVKKEIEEEEAEIISKEKFWETPTFSRKKMIQGQ